MEAIKNNYMQKLLRQEWTLSLPAIVIVVLVTQGFFLGTIILSTLKWNIIRPDIGISFVGIANFIKLLSASETYKIIFTTLSIAFISLFLSFSFGFAIALLLNRNFLVYSFFVDSYLFLSLQLM